MRFLAVECLILLLIGSLAAAASIEMSGKWTARTLMGPSGSETPVPTTFTFQVEAGKLSGTVKSPRGNFEIMDAKVDGDSIRFSVIVNANNNRFKMLYDGKIAADGIDFISKIEGGDRSDHFLARRLAD